MRCVRERCEDQGKNHQYEDRAPPNKPNQKQPFSYIFLKDTLTFRKNFWDGGEIKKKFSHSNFLEESYKSPLLRKVTPTKNKFWEVA